MPIYMKIEGIKGSSTAAGHVGWIELESCQLGMHRNVTNSTGRGTNKGATVPSVSDIVITKMQDEASTALFNEALSGTGKKITIEFVSSDSTAPYLSIELEGALISSYNINGHGGSAHNQPMESISLNFAKISYTQKVAPSDPKHAMNVMEWSQAVSQIA